VVPGIVLSQELQLASVGLQIILWLRNANRQPLGFENHKYPDRVYELSKALYELKEASWAWYARLKTFLLEHGYVMGSVDKTLFTLKHGNDFLLVQIYMDDMIFGGSSHSLVSSF
jgi:hypothetical protein